MMAMTAREGQKHNGFDGFSIRSGLIVECHWGVFNVNKYSSSMGNSWLHIWRRLREEVMMEIKHSTAVLVHPHKVRARVKTGPWSLPSYVGAHKPAALGIFMELGYWSAWKKGSGCAATFLHGSRTSSQTMEETFDSPEEKNHCGRSLHPTTWPHNRQVAFPEIKAMKAGM